LTDAGSKKGKGNKPVNTNAVVAEVMKPETVKGKQCNCLFWSPAGHNIIMASLGDSASGALDFYDGAMKEYIKAINYVI